MPRTDAGHARQRIDKQGRVAWLRVAEVEEKPVGQGEAAVGEEGGGTRNRGDRDMATLRYAGIGARATPAAVLADMDRRWRDGWPGPAGICRAAGRTGRIPRSQPGAPAGQRTVWLPWRGYNGYRGQDCRMLSAAELSACIEIAAPLHPAWNRCSPAVRKLHARNAAVLLD